MGAPAPQEWVFSPDPAVEAAVRHCRRRRPPFYQEGTRRILPLLDKLGNPQSRLPHTFHVAGTNGKGSTLAFIESILRAHELCAHKYISPHLVRFEERILPYGELIGRDLFLSLSEEVESACDGLTVSFFDFYTALAFLAFSRLPADAVLLETGCGGEKDATNVLGGSVTAIITRISFDHMRLLGNTLPEIAAHKAGIIREGQPCVLAPQPDDTVIAAVRAAATTKKAPLLVGGQGWSVSLEKEGFLYNGTSFSLRLPRPALQGDHQIINAATAIAALEQSPFSGCLSQEKIAQGVTSATWAGRLQRLRQGHLAGLLPAGWELWLDGAHNDSGAEVLAAAVRAWADGKPLHLVMAMKKNKDAEIFRRLLVPLADSVTVLEEGSGGIMQGACDLRARLSAEGGAVVRTAENLESALRALVFEFQGQRRILVTGSLYLAGQALRLNETAYRSCG